MPFNRKPTRLNAITYLGHKAHFVTICCDRRRTYLFSPASAEHVISILRECAAKGEFHLHAYCAMPDHLHFLAHGTHPVANLLEFVRIFKLRSAYDFKKTSGLRLWERSYYDHILRKADDLESVAGYIWANPIRAGLCVSPREYPFSGSNTIDWINSKKPCPEFTPPWRQLRPV